MDTAADHNTPQQPDRIRPDQTARPSSVPAGDINSERGSFSIEDTIPWSEIQTKNSLFNPGDPWAVTTREGLLKLNDWADMRVIEVGVGTGITTGVVLREHPELMVLFGTDLDENAIRVTTANVHTIAQNAAERFVPIEGAHDLLSGFLASEYSKKPLDRVFACIPQMLAPRENYHPEPDALAHYLRPEDTTGVPVIDQHGMALNAKMLMQAREALKADGSVVLTVSGRPPWHVVEFMFQRAGFSEPLKLHSKLIPQDPGTSIEELAQIERDLLQEGVRFEFWGADDVEHIDGAHSPLVVRSDRRPMDAKEAAASLKAGRFVYHELHVVEARKRSN